MQPFICIMIILFSGCSQVEHRGKELAIITSQNQDEEKIDNITKVDGTDSLHFLEALTKALDYVNTNLGKDAFSYIYDITPDDSSFTITTELVYGNLFDKRRKNLLMRRHSPNETLLDLYVAQDQKLMLQLSRLQEGMTYLGDTIMDVNGDTHRDYVVKWYPSSGCCLRNISNVYLYLFGENKFSKDYEFINPTFSPREKIIRGVEYGHPGEAGLYKYRWNGLRVDTVEFIYPTPWIL